MRTSDVQERRKRVKVYALSTCPVCKKVRSFLDQHQVPTEYIEVDLLDSGEQWLMTKELKKYNPQGGYPTTVVEEVVKGFDEDGLKRAIGLP
jgi:glutaredoxin-like protein NrdH